MIRCCWLTGILFSVLLVANAQTGMSVFPMKLMFNTVPGHTESRYVTIINSSADELHITTRLADWSRDSMGSIIYREPGQLPGSCSNWLMVLPSADFILQPGEQKEVEVVISPPGKLQDSLKNSMLFFSQVAPAAGKARPGVNIDFLLQVGVQVIYSPPVLRVKEVDILDFSYEPKGTRGNNGAALALLLCNIGQMEANGTVNIELINLGAMEKTILKQEEFYTLPRGCRVLRVRLPAFLPPGTYDATALIDTGPEQELKIGMLEFKLE